MKIGLRGGHSPNCIGARGYVDEYTECQKLYKRVEQLLVEVGNTVINCNTSESSMQQDCFVGENRANANNVDFFATIHMNAGGGRGTEVWCYNSSSSKAIAIGKRICDNISDLGYVNRGVKFNSAFFDLYRTNAESIIIETLFVDSEEDTQRFNVEETARAIANGIDPRVKLSGAVENEPIVETPAPKPEPTPAPAPSVPLPNVFYRVKENGRWLPEVKNDSDYAGIMGAPITDVAIRVDKGSIQYRVHVKGGNWLSWIRDCDISDINKYAGNGRAIDAIQVIYYTPSDVAHAHGYKYAKYRVSPVYKNYYSWQLDDIKEGNMDGYAGCFGVSIDKLQIVLGK